VAPGERRDVEIKVARLPTGIWISLPIQVLHGREPGPSLWLSAALHGDELNGMEIVHRVLRRLDPDTLRGTVIAAPVVNVFGFLEQSRYLPDRRDLNRSFPGSPKGSLASRLAHLVTENVISRCQYGIDFHTGSAQRTNLPQIRADLDDPETRSLALAFGAPLIFKAKEIAGSLRATARRKGAVALVFEGGEPLRFNRRVIEVGVRGALAVMGALEMWEAPGLAAAPPIFEARSVRWVRANRSGIFHLDVELGQRVEKGQVLGWLSEPLGDQRRPVPAPSSGIVLAHTNSPLVYQGDALIHLAAGDRSG
jgi:hypothetical protein